MIGSVVGGELVRLAIEREAPLRDPVSIASDDGTKIWRLLRDVLVECIESEHDVAELFAAIPHPQRDDRRAVRHHAHFHTVRVGEREELY